MLYRISSEYDLVKKEQCGHWSNERQDYRGQHVHKGLDEHNVDDTGFREPDHPHHSELESFGFHADHQQRVEEQHTQNCEKQQDDIKNKAQEQHRHAVSLHLFEDI